MTDKTTRIWVELTDEQMNAIDREWWGAPTLSPRALIRDAVVAQRPRPIAVGDRVTYPGDPKVYNVEATRGEDVWLWHGDRCIGTYSTRHLTRVDDEAKQ